jgi:hypothetical protein
VMSERVDLGVALRHELGSRLSDGLGLGLPLRLGREGAVLLGGVSRLGVVGDRTECFLRLACYLARVATVLTLQLKVRTNRVV